MSSLAAACLPPPVQRPLYLCFCAAAAPAGPAAAAGLDSPALPGTGIQKRRSFKVQFKQNG